MDSVSGLGEVKNIGSMDNQTHASCESAMKLGLGLRSEHYEDCIELLTSPEIAQKSVQPPDFFEIHAENFFMDGGIVRELLEDLQAKTALSIHGTSLGLASHTAIPEAHLKRFARLVRQVNPLFVSDHACLNWFKHPDSALTLHAGDLLPFAFDQQTLQATIDNVNRVQDAIGRQLLVENLSSYLSFAANQGSHALTKLQDDKEAETNFFNSLCAQTQCGLLVDLNNLCVNAHNMNLPDIADYARNWLAMIDAGLIGEYHLSGCTPAGPGELMVDDHAQPVSELCWELLPYALTRNPAAVMIERDNNLPPFSTLLQEVESARAILKKNAKQATPHG